MILVLIKTRVQQKRIQSTCWMISSFLIQLPVGYECFHKISFKFFMATSKLRVVATPLDIFETNYMIKLNIKLIIMYPVSLLFKFSLLHATVMRFGALRFWMFRLRLRGGVLWFRRRMFLLRWRVLRFQGVIFRLWGQMLRFRLAWLRMSMMVTPIAQNPSTFMFFHIMMEISHINIELHSKMRNKNMEKLVSLRMKTLSSLINRRTSKIFLMFD